MALLFMDSFDHYATADLTKKWSGAIPISFEVIPSIGATGRHSSNGIRWAAGNFGGRTLTKLLATSGATVVVGFAFVQYAGTFSSLVVGTIFDPTIYNQANYVVAIRQAGTVQVWVRINQSGTLTVLRGSTELGTTVKALTAGAGLYSFIELKVLIDSSVGTVNLQVNQEVWLSLTAQNTRNAASATWDEILIGGMRGGGSPYVGWDYDDVYVLDGAGPAPWNTFLGDCRVDVRNPTAAGATTGWTPSAGANWQNVDDVAPNDDTDYNSVVTLNAVDTFVTQDAPVAGATIFGVQHCINAKKSDIGPCAIASVIRPSGTDQVGASAALGTGYSYLLQVAATIPGSAGPDPWTEAAFNAAEFGYKRVG